MRIELRFVERNGERIMQYRTTVLVGSKDDAHFDWGPWRDIPVVKDES